MLHQGQDLAHRRTLVRHNAVVQIHLLRQRTEISSVEYKSIFQFRLRCGLLQSAQVGPAEIPLRPDRTLHRGGFRV